MSKPHVEILYTNHRGEVHTYRIQPIELTREPNPYHPGVPYLILAILLLKDGHSVPGNPQLRTFDPAKIQSWRVLP